MGIAKESLRDRDVFFDYDFEEALFRFDHRAKTFFCKLYGQPSEVEIPHDDRLVNEALRFGEEVSEALYRAGKPRR